MLRTRGESDSEEERETEGRGDSFQVQPLIQRKGDAKTQHADRAFLLAYRNLWGLWSVLPLNCEVQKGLLS